MSSNTQQVNRKIAAIHQSIPVCDIRSIPLFDAIVIEHAHAHKITGYFATISLNDTAITVPIVHQYNDREGCAYLGGRSNAPLLTLEQWRTQIKRHPTVETPHLMVNANFFHVPRDPKGHCLPLRTVSRTTLYGLSLSNGAPVSSPFNFNRAARATDTLFFNQATRTAKLVNYQNVSWEMSHNRPQSHLSAVSGYTILKNRRIKETPHILTKPDKAVARTGIGILPGGKKVIVMVVESKHPKHGRSKGGVTIKQFTQLFQALGCHDAINLDGGGSSELLYKGSDIFGHRVKIQSKTSDKERSERPKPNFIGFRVATRARFFSYDDSDITKEMRKKVNCLTKADAIALLKK